LFQIAQIPGESDYTNWKKDRDDGETFVGPIGEDGWTGSQTRGALARWLVHAAENMSIVLVGKMPAVSRLSGSKHES
jgi:hypothetical protein